MFIRDMGFFVVLICPSPSSPDADCAIAKKYQINYYEMRFSMPDGMLLPAVGTKELSSAFLFENR